jgi:diaminohydroxyphosphoribosylaminopyrimidine deaminase/5-amino-6-(5-phosphoribosylamino)uracil reductase
MRQALELAQRGQGFVEPNPMVGAVVVRDGQVVGEGWHERFGEAHAEVIALRRAGDAARGGTLYVTLEPCCHQGKTPPCTEAVLRSGVARVVVAMQDAFPAVAGKGLAQLRSAGLVVEVGACEAEARVLNAPFSKLIDKGQPFVIAKWAMTLDGKIATRTGDSKWITGEAARAKAHELRARVDGILVGIGTALADDPLLTARPTGPRIATRVVLDSQLRLPADSQLVRTVKHAPLLLVHAADAPAERQMALERFGCELLALPSVNGRVSIAALLQNLGERRWTNLLVEGGAAVLGSFFDAQAIDEVWAFVAPKLLGGAAAPAPIAGVGLEHVASALRLDGVSIEALGEDWLVRGRPARA